MATVNTPLAEKAESIFSDLGYVVSGESGELRAERKWRVVHVTPMEASDEAPPSGDLRCFVTWDEQAQELRRRLTRASPDYEWALIGVDESGDYEVVHAAVNTPGGI
jgi:hypothetical protein